MARPVVFTLCLRTPFRSVCLSVWMSGCLNVDDHDAPLSMPLTGRRAPEEPLKNHPPTQTVNHPNGDRFRPLGTLANCSICTDDKDKGHFGFARHLVRIQIYFGMLPNHPSVRLFPSSSAWGANGSRNGLICFKLFSLRKFWDFGREGRGENIHSLIGLAHNTQA